MRRGTAVLLMAGITSLAAASNAAAASPAPGTPVPAAPACCCSSSLIPELLSFATGSACLPRP